MGHNIAVDIEYKKNPYKGLYIALEGIDGSGKTEQVKRLTDYFGSKGKKVLTVREPRKESGIIKSITNDILQGNIEVPREAYQYLFTADRIIQFHDVIIPALKKGTTIISDRSFWSAIPYGMWERGGKSVNEAKVILLAQGLLAMQHGCLLPDITFYLQVPIDTALRRIKQKVGVKEEIYEKKEILEKVLKGYAWLRKEFPDEFTIIDAKNSIEEVTKDMIQKIEKK